MPYICPLCSEPLTLIERTYRCSHSHSFDLAKEGYINLLPVQHKGSKEPGDNKDMMLARRQFLDSGHYHPLRKRLGMLLNKHILPVKEKSSPPDTLTLSPQHTLLDIGCGEGYYTAFLANELNTSRCYGLDISKSMIRSAAKRYKNTHFLVASSQRLPFLDASLDAITRIYAPCDPTELSRTLKQGGIFITVTPAARHLYQLKEKIYNDVRLHESLAENLPQFSLIDENRLSYSMSLNSQDATTLLQMTPFAWRAPKTLWDTLSALEYFSCEVDFMLRVYQKN